METIPSSTSSSPIVCVISLSTSSSPETTSPTVRSKSTVVYTLYPQTVPSVKVRLMRCFRKPSYWQGFLSLCLLSILCLSLLFPTLTLAQTEYDDLSGVNVAVYNGLGVMGSSHIALTRMFEWMNATVSSVTASQILDDVLNDYDIFVIPGGSESTCSSELDDEGRLKIIEFVANGGSYFGICGGSTFAVRYLHLFNGFMGPVSEPGDLIHMTTMHINRTSNGPDLSNLSENCSVMYYASQRFTPNPYQATSIHSIATYDYDGSAGMIAFEYENGTVFLSSPHPEYEENSDRDDTSFGDDLEDSDSEWDLLFQVSLWLIETSYVELDASTTTTTTSSTALPLDLPLITVVSTGVVIITLIAVVLYRRGP